MSGGSLPGTAAKAPRDLRTLTRVLAAILMPLGPACIAVSRVVFPDVPVGESIFWNLDTHRFSTFALGLPALFTLLPGAYAALHLGRRHRPVLTAWAAAFLIPGYLAMTVLGAGDWAVFAAHDIGMDAPTTTRLSDEIFALTTGPVLIFVVGHVVGTVLLGILAIRARLMPLWAAILLAVSQPLHFTAVMIENVWVDLVGWGLTALGMAFLALRVLRTPNDEWDLPPLAATASTVSWTKV